jgi:hypothetical protein
MATLQQTEVNAIEYVGANGAGTIVTAESEMLEISDDELEAVNGGAMRVSNANFDRHRVAKKMFIALPPILCPTTNLH